MPQYQRFLVSNGRVDITGGKCYPHYGLIINSSSSKESEPKEINEVVGGSLGNSDELLRRLNSINVLKKPSNDLKNKLLAVEPKKKLINFTI